MNKERQAILNHLLKQITLAQVIGIIMLIPASAALFMPTEWSGAVGKYTFDIPVSFFLYLVAIWLLTFKYIASFVKSIRKK